jgi:hypothetical protein
MEPATTRLGTQGISPRPKNQQVRVRHPLLRLEQDVTPAPGVLQPLRSRGDEAVRVMGSRARRSVDAHQQKRVVMART